MPAKLQVKLSKKQIKELEKLKRKKSDYRSERATIILLNYKGHSAYSIAEMIGCHHHTAREHIKNFTEKGIDGLIRDYSPGRPNNLRQKAIKKVKEYLQHPPSDYKYHAYRWSKALLQKQFTKDTGEDISSRTMNRALREAGFSYKKPKKTMPDNAPSKEEKLSKLDEVCAEIKEFAKNDEVEIILVDESHFSNEPYHSRGWFKSGSPFFPQNTKKEGKLHYFWRLEHNGEEILLEKRKKG